MIISICGKSGSGKTTLSTYLKEIYGEKVIHIDIDKIAHYILNLEEVKNELVKNFGNSVLSEKLVDRKKLGSIVFNSRDKMNVLANITWKYMEKEIDKIIENNNDRVIILDYILIYKTEYFKKSDIKILLDVPYEIRKERCMLRDNISEKDFDLRDKFSIEYSKEDFDYVIKNINEFKKVKLL